MFYNPYADIYAAALRPQRVNFHTHAGVCDEEHCGRLEMEDVIDAYGKAGYDALCVTNHNKYLPYPAGDRGVSLLDGVEYSETPHMLMVGVNCYEDMTHQQAVDYTLARGGFAVLCHPNWQYKEYWPRADMEKLSGYIGMEIFNHLIFRLNGSGLATDAWDHMLSLGRKVFGFGSDDFHEWQDIARAWNVIYARSAAFGDIKDAVLRGRFYVSTGMALERFDFDGRLLTVKAAYLRPTYVESMAYSFVGGCGKALGSLVGAQASIDVPPDEPYVRVEVTGEQGAKLFTQPLLSTAVFKV